MEAKHSCPLVITAYYKRLDVVTKVELHTNKESVDLNIKTNAVLSVSSGFRLTRGTCTATAVSQ